MTTATCGRTAIGAAALLIAGAALLGLGTGCGGLADQRQLTILLVEYEGPQAGATGEALAGELASKGITDVFVVAGPNHASVCLGRFSSMRDPRAIAQLQRVGRIQDDTGQRPFIGAALVPIPEAPPEDPWPLEKAKGQYTLHVASWGASGRQAAAQDYARELRARGLEAYVYHGPRLSMVTIGSFGPEIFDKPELVGQPGPKPTVTRVQGKLGVESHIEIGQPSARPKVIGPAALKLIQQFPTMRLDGQLTEPEAGVPTILVSIPRRDDEKSMGVARTYFDIDLALINARTGQGAGPGRASGRARSVPELPTVTGAMTRQLLAGLGAARSVRIGVLTIMALNPDAARGRADAAVLKQVEATLRAAGPDKVQLFNADTTLGLLDAAGLGVADVVRDPTLLDRLKNLDYVVIGSVTLVTAGAAPTPTSAPAPARSPAPAPGPISAPKPAPAAAPRQGGSLP